MDAQSGVGAAAAGGERRVRDRAAVPGLARAAPAGCDLPRAEREGDLRERALGSAGRSAPRADPDGAELGQSMIPKSGYRFSEKDHAPRRSWSGDDDSKKSHLALSRNRVEQARSAP